eukprot:14835849-Ditylum_brightwellii.AAC.1
MTLQWKLEILLCKTVRWRADLMHWCVPHKTVTTRAASQRVTQAKAGRSAAGARSVLRRTALQDVQVMLYGRRR